ncbi:uncharacterized protein BJ212DRAFT_940457 [Suillus subaureus]|uniref:Uncharacterized protein n=1 Tax=Suillus subaureus TaxID=48587 RepID=A0A9P7DW08_9AGAM|nr:uncharacterized protein BJ212DRAFT_940457 [Suillus subaureus]KAG1804238.1 hypothetical protein BJ212DRAFT_940457 [Suillus subaureus]
MYVCTILTDVPLTTCTCSRMSVLVLVCPACLLFALLVFHLCVPGAGVIFAFITLTARFVFASTHSRSFGHVRSCRRLSAPVSMHPRSCVQCLRLLYSSRKRERLTIPNLRE